MSRLTIVAIGSRGDVQPYAALGLGLQEAGLQVHLATHGEFRDFVSGRGLAFAAVAGWSHPPQGALPGFALRLEEAPHDWLFPRMGALVHHGGAGTTGAGLRAGVASIVVPFFADQPFRGRRVAALGVGPPPSPTSV